jgi:hypothetical protein
MVQGWYQGGISVFDFTDPKQVKEIAYFDRGPMDASKLFVSGSWSAYWYNGLIYSSEITRGLDILEQRKRPGVDSRATPGRPPPLAATSRPRARASAATPTRHPPPRSRRSPPWHLRGGG